METKEQAEYSETLMTQVWGSREFNEERTLGFQVYRTKRPKENVGWLITTFFLFFSLLFSVSRITIIGQFLDDVLFNLPWGWLKFPIYLTLFVGLIAFYFNYHFKFRLSFILLVSSVVLVTSWLISLAVLTYLYDRQILLYGVAIDKLWDKQIFAKSFQIYWFNWKDLSVFGTNYASQTKVDFLFKNQGYVSFYGGGGVLGYLLASGTYYLSLPGAYLGYLGIFALITSWLLTGDPIYLVRPKNKRYGRALRLLALKAQNKPREVSSPLISTKNVLPWAENEPDPYLSTELLTLQRFDDQQSVQTSSLALDDFLEDSEFLDEETLVPEAEDLMTISDLPPSALTPTAKEAPTKQSKFASSILQTSLEEKITPRFQSRRAPTSQSPLPKTNSLNEIPLAKLQQKRNTHSTKVQPTHQTQSEIYNRLDPQEARRLFERETSVTPFGKTSKTPLFGETNYSDYQLPTLSLLDPETNQVLSRQHNQNCAEQIVNHLNYWLSHQNLDAQCELIALGEAVSRYHFVLGPKLLNPTLLINQEAELKSITKVASWRWVNDSSKPNSLAFEIPNPTPVYVQLKTVLQGIPQNKQNYPLLFGLGKRLSGELLTANLENMPHILIAGQTQSGKTMLLNNLLASLLLRNKPDEVKLVILDSPNQELINFAHLPHLLTPLVSNSHHVAPLFHKLSQLINQRYHLFNSLKVNNIEAYNKHPNATEKLTYVVVVINEIGNLKQSLEWNTINSALRKLTEQGQNFGLHFVIATSQPSSNFQDSILLRNCPTRLSFKLPTLQDSQAILGQAGAEKLTTPGDLLFVYPGARQLIRAQSVLLSPGELKRLLTFIYHQMGVPGSVAS